MSPVLMAVGKATGEPQGDYTEVGEWVIGLTCAGAQRRTVMDLAWPRVLRTEFWNYGPRYVQPAECKKSISKISPIEHKKKTIATLGGNKIDGVM